jgi:hypothetical protein
MKKLPLPKTSPLCKRCDLPSTVRLIHVIAREVASDERPQLAAELLVLSCGIYPKEITLSYLARRHKITKQAASKRFLRTQRFFDDLLKP